MVSLTVKETIRDGDENYVEKRHYDFPVVVEDTSDKYIGVREDGSYRIFSRETVVALDNSTGEIQDSDGLVNIDHPVIDIYCGEFKGIIHGDLELIP